MRVMKGQSRAFDHSKSEAEEAYFRLKNVIKRITVCRFGCNRRNHHLCNMDMLLKP